MLKNLFCILLVGLLAACSSSDNFIFRISDTQLDAAEKLTTQLRTEQIKSVSQNSLSFQMASLDSNNHIDITADSPVVKFLEGNSFVAPLFLPEHLDRFTFVLESAASRTVFVPSVIFLNENLEEVVSINNALFNSKGFFSIEKTFSGEIAQSIRYMLVYSKDSELNGRTEIVNVAREYELSKGKVVTEVSFPRLYVKHSPIGKLDIRFEDVFYSAEASTNSLDRKNSKQTSPTDEKPVILSDTEDFYLQQISKALQEGNDSRAKLLVKEAQRAGSIKAQAYYMEELEINKY